eukprot:2327098-Pleurochrysis_carterae.AAC.1
MLKIRSLLNDGLPSFPCTFRSGIPKYIAETRVRREHSEGTHRPGNLGARQPESTLKANAQRKLRNYLVAREPKKNMLRGNERSRFSELSQDI